MLHICFENQLTESTYVCMVLGIEPRAMHSVTGLPPNLSISAYRMH